MSTSNQPFEYRLAGVAETEKQTIPDSLEHDVEADIERELHADDGKAQKIYVASQWQLMWRRFRKHKLAMISAVIIIFFFLVGIFAEAVAPYEPETVRSNLTYAPPQGLMIWDNGLSRPFVYGYTSKVDPTSLRRTFVLDPTKKLYLSMFVPGESYKLWGLFDSNIRLFGTGEPTQPYYMLGADRLGRDLLSQLVHGTRISMSIGLVSVFMSLLLGISMGGISGFYGGMSDNIIQRAIELIRSIPQIPLWMGLSAAIPLTWSPLATYFGITMILALLSWTGLARVVRGRFLALREEDFVMAAKIAGSSESRIIFRHMVPSFLSHIIASLTLSIPGSILAETGLSFLGLGLRPPINSWGVLLQETQNIRSVATAPWLMTPAIALMIVVLAYNFFGDGLRDAADPYSN